MAKYQLTKQEIIKEVMKCGKSPEYFLKSYARISHPVKGLIPFKTYDYQDELLKDFNNYRFNIILKARQLGITTLIAGYCAWIMLFYRNKEILIVSTKERTAAKVVKRVKTIIKHLPSWLKISNIAVDNRNSIELENGSTIQASSTSIDAGRSESLSLLILDEAAHIANAEEIWAAAYSTLSTGGRCIIGSTPNGVGNFFHKTFVEAQSEKNDFHPTTLLWNVHPDRDQEWFDKETKNMTPREIAQELCGNFNMSGETVFRPEDIERILSEIKEPKHRTAFDRNLWVWEEYRAQNSYLLVADVARGDGKDYSTIQLLKLETMEVVAEYQGKVTPDLFSNLLNQVGREYGNCMIVVENNSVGFAVLEKLKEFQYPNIYYSNKSSHEFVEAYYGETNSGNVAGFTTSTKTRPLIIAKLEEFIRNKAITIYSRRLVEEMRTFIWNGGRPEAMRSYNDDLIMSLAIASWIKDTVFTSCHRDLEYKRAFLDCISSSRVKLETRIDGMNGRKPVQSKEYEMYKWLISSK